MSLCHTPSHMPSPMSSLTSSPTSVITSDCKEERKVICRGVFGNWWATGINGGVIRLVFRSKTKKSRNTWVVCRGNATHPKIIAQSQSLKQAQMYFRIVCKFGESHLKRSSNQV